MSEASSEEREQRLTSIADDLSELSEAQTVPINHNDPQAPFQPDEVDFDDVGSWLKCVLQVQEWLNLGQLINDKSAEAAVKSLAELLLDDASDEDKSTLTLTEAVLSALEGRVSSALDKCQAFITNVEVRGQSVEGATETWKEAWENDAMAAVATGPVSAKTETRKISTLISDVERGRTDLNPSYQRGDVWPTKDAQKLIESIVRGIPLPSIILLQPKGELVAQVVDGKQRITSILRFVGKHPQAVAAVTAADRDHPDKNLLKLFTTDYRKFKSAWKAAGAVPPLSATTERELKFPFPLPKGKDTGLVNGLEHLQGKYFTEIESEEVQIAEWPVEIRDIFFGDTGYLVPIIQYLQATQRQIHEVFGLYNRQGKQLNAEEIRNAVYHHLDLARAVLAVSGDNPDVDAVAPFLNPSWAQLSRVGKELETFGFGTDRYKRSKVLAWVLAHLVLDSTKPDGTKSTLTTAKLINDMFDRVSGAAPYHNQPPHPLTDTDTISKLMELVGRAIEAHRAFEESWDPSWLNSSGTPAWQELQLVGSLLGVTIAALHHGTKLDQVLSAKVLELQKLTAGKQFARDPKTQTLNQWEMIGRWAIGIAEVLDADLGACDKKIRKQFGGSGIAVLEALSKDWKAKAKP